MGKRNKYLRRFLSFALSAAMAVTLLPVPPAYATEISTDSGGGDLPAKLAHFSFDSDVTSGGSATAVVNGSGAVLSESDAAAGSGALSLDGASWLTVQNSDGSNPIAGKKEMTISYFSKATDEKNGWVFHISQDSVNNYPKEHYVAVVDGGSGDELAGRITSQRWNNTEKVPGQRDDNGFYVDNVLGWKQVTLVYEETKTSLYINGQLKNSKDPEVELMTILGETGGTFQIGKANWGSGEYYKGLIDEFIVYDGALTADQVKSEYLAFAETPTRDAIRSPCWGRTMA